MRCKVTETPPSGQLKKNKEKNKEEKTQQQRCTLIEINKCYEKMILRNGNNPINLFALNIRTQNTLLYLR